MWDGQDEEQEGREKREGIRTRAHDTTHTRAASKENEPGEGRKWAREGGRAGERKGGEGDAGRDG